MRRLLVRGVLVWFVWSVGSVVLLRWIDPPTTAFIVADRIHAAFGANRGYRFQHHWVDRTQISASAKLAVIASEDQRFADHYGFDLVQIEHALLQRERGESTRLFVGAFYIFIAKAQAVQNFFCFMLYFVATCNFQIVQFIRIKQQHFIAAISF